MIPILIILKLNMRSSTWNFFFYFGDEGVSPDLQFSNLEGQAQYLYPRAQDELPQVLFKYDRFPYNLNTWKNQGWEGMTPQ